MLQEGDQLRMIQKELSGLEIECKGRDRSAEDAGP